MILKRNGIEGTAHEWERVDSVGSPQGKLPKVLTDEEIGKIIHSECIGGRWFVSPNARAIAKAQYFECMWGMVDWLKQWKGFYCAGLSVEMALKEQGIERRK